MSPKAISGMSRAFFDSDLLAARLILFVGEFFWAAMLFWPGDTFNRPTYSGMAMVAPELAWATAFAISAALQIRIVALGLEQTWLSEGFAIWNAFFWVSVVVLMLASVSPPPAAIGGEVASSFAATWIAVRPFIIRFWEHKHGLKS